VSCEECTEIVFKGDPPCHDCPRPKLIRSNALAWDIWVKCNNYGRGVSFADIATIEMKTLLDLLEVYDGSREDFEKVLFIEEIALPILRERNKEESSTDSEDKAPRR